MDWRVLERLEEEGLVGYIEPHLVESEELSEEEELVKADDFARRMLKIILALLMASESYHFFQLKQEDLIPLADWSQEALLEVIYAALTKEGWPVYLFLPEQTSLLVLDNSQACPVYSLNEAWLEKLTALLDQEGLLMTD
ncbi:hypothetical protein [Streptococcus sp.]|uniref:hypothetical protein n=1 Tax=Streptococcus sp. TaxID=1306 RepID=UPI0035A0892B